MIVYAETNFLLEIAYLQEGSESCLEILDLARNGRLTLAVPAFSLIEARQTWNRRSSEHKALQNQLQPIIRQLARSGPFTTVTESSLELLKALESGEDTRIRLEDLITDLSSIARIQLLDSDIAARARQAARRPPLRADGTLPPGPVLPSKQGGLERNDLMVLPVGRQRAFGGGLQGDREGEHLLGTLRAFAAS